MLEVVSVAIFNIMRCNETSGVGKENQIKNKIACSPNCGVGSVSDSLVKLFSLGLFYSYKDLFPPVCSL